MKISYVKYGIILLVVFIVCMGSSLAYYNWVSPINTNVTFTAIADCAKIYYDAGEKIEGVSLFPTDNKEDGIKKEITIRTDSYNASAKFNLYLDINSLPDGLKDETLKYVLYGLDANGNLYTINTSGIANSLNSVTGNFSVSSISSLGNCNIDGSKKHIVLLNNIIPTTTETKYVLYIWIDGTSGINPNSMMNQEFEFSLHADGECLISPDNSGNNGASNITSIFTSASKSTVTTAGGESIIQASSVGLMQDSFGNIRYYGENPNNYVTFNGEEAGWRIIGIFDVEDENGNTEKRIKLIRASSIGSYAYDNKLSGVGSSDDEYGSNDWTDARLMMLLNPGYEQTSSLYAYEGSLYWNRKSGTCYAGINEGTTSCDFTSTGLTTSAKNMIGQAKYYLGGSSSYDGLYADDYYNFERGTEVYSGHNTTWTGYIGIMYPSDYAYATDLSVCSKDGYNYDGNTNCKGKDWLLDTSNSAWTIAPDASNSYFAFFVRSSGYVDNDGVCNSRGVRPVLYLKSDVSIASGEGTSTNPYILS